MCSLQGSQPLTSTKWKGFGPTYKTNTLIDSNLVALRVQSSHLTVFIQGACARLHRAVHPFCS
jgi:hypothetical protein